jgi:protein-tyrosine phosphatase
LIDLHSHILPGLDDGPDTMEQSITLARLAAADGTRTMVATPHVREDYEFDLDEIASRTDEVNVALEDESIPVRVVAGAEVALSKLSVFDDETLRRLCLGDSSYLLVESPYTEATDLLEAALFDLQLRGFRVLLAHPERSPTFHKNTERLADLVERGILCSVTAGSMAGRFGRTVTKTTRSMFRGELVHNVASDTHDANRRPPALQAGFRLLDKDLPGLVDQLGWYTGEVPGAILADERLPHRPETPAVRRRIGF